MNLHLQRISKLETRNSKLEITGSKSETNRLLLLRALYPNIQIENASSSDDSEVMIQALVNNPKPETRNPQPINVHHAGTAMRFLTAYFAIQEDKQVILTGSSRMKERPIKILVDALRELGATIEYVENDGFPPIKITGKKLTKNKVSLPANVSSQYISALLLIAPKLENGLELTLIGEITSAPYIKMTLALLNEIGVTTSFEENKIQIKPLLFIPPSGVRGLIESDWSSASYYFSIIALSEIGTAITLSSFKENSLQADSVLPEIYKDFGVETMFNNNNSITISKTRNPQPNTYNLQPETHNPQPATRNSQPITRNLQNSPDIAQTIAVTCFGLGIGCHLTGLHTLKIKETDRLEALKTELTKLGANVSITNDSLTLIPNLHFSEVLENEISTYQDHRMAMAFAPLALKIPIIICEAEVVSKSYPTFWEDIKSIGFLIEKK